jgi:hypothetical protein
MDTKFTGDGGNMVNETEVLKREKLRGWRWVYVKIWEWKTPSLLPTFNFCLNLWGPKQVCLLRSYSSFFLGWHVHVWTTTVVLRAVSTAFEVRLLIKCRSGWSKGKPTIGGNSRHNVCVYACKFHNPYETLCGFEAVSIFPGEEPDNIPPTGRSTTGASHFG